MSKAIILPALLLVGCTVNEPPEARADSEARLATELAKYEQAGEPVACVPHTQLKGNRSAGDAIIFDGTGGRIWVNRPAGGCPTLDHGRALQTRTSGSQLCRGDIATVFDPVSGTTWGGCGLGDFTPYERRDRADT